MLHYVKVLNAFIMLQNIYILNKLCSFELSVLIIQFSILIIIIIIIIMCFELQISIYNDVRRVMRQ